MPKISKLIQSLSKVKILISQNLPIRKKEFQRRVIRDRNKIKYDWSQYSAITKFENKHSGLIKESWITLETW